MNVSCAGRGGRVRATGRILAVWLVVVAWVTLAAPGAVAATPVRGPDTTAKYYVVPPPVGGQKEFLFDVAVKTLGNGKRYREIFELNQGRPQPDGGRLTDPMDLRPGWILLLPPDAQGPDVHTGALSSVGAAPAGGAAATTGPATPLPPGNTAHPGGGTGVGTVLMLVGGILVALPLLGGLLLLGVRWRRSAAPAGRPVPGPAPLAGPRPEPAPGPLPDLVPGPAPTWVPGTATEWLPGPTSEPMAQPEPEPEPEPQPVAESQPEPEIEPVTEPLPFGSADRPAEPAAERPPTAADPALPHLRAELTGDQDRLAVRLIGVVPGREAPAYAWLADGEAMPPATMPVVLGRSGRWWLHVDLAATPDVVTVTGPAPGRRRLASAIVGQLLDADVRVIAVGDALGTDVPDRCERLGDFPAAPEGAVHPDRPYAVICGELHADWAALARVTAAGRRSVTVVVGEVARSRWSVEVAAPGGVG